MVTVTILVMADLDRDHITDLLSTAENLLSATDVVVLRQELQTLEAQTVTPDFWQRADAQEVMQNRSALQAEVDEIEAVTQTKQDVHALTELLVEMEASAEEEQLAALRSELIETGRRFTKQLKQLELSQFLSGPYDRLGAMISIHSGQGGTEAMDWTDMLRRMYTRYFERKGWKYEFISESRGEEAGIKEASYEINAPFAYGYLKGERGTHRLVRQSPFNADNLRQTSFALVEVMPLIEAGNKDIEVKENELSWHFTRAGAAGAQNPNKPTPAVEFTHLPTAIVVRCREERSQGQNKERALKLLKARLAMAEEDRQQQQLAQVKGNHQNASWGSQIRNYVLHPYQLVKDTRTEVETSDTAGVLDGDLDQFVTEEVKLNRPAAVTTIQASPQP